MPVRGGPHAELAIRFADAIARHHDATVVVLHLVPPGITLAVRAQAERALAAFVKQHLAGRGEALLREAPNVRNAILREAEKADLVVMGASAQTTGARRRDAPVRGAARRRSPPARSRRSSWSRRARPSSGPRSSSSPTRAETLAAADRAAEEARAVPVRVERWFGESNFHHAEFADLRRLVTLKEKQGLTISLVLPTLNEEETIGPIVRKAMREMVGRVPLLDEVLVIDSASTDRTREIAEAEGARVVQHPDVLTRYGSFRGKGEALWKSLYETTRRHRRLGRHGREELAPADGLRDARAAAPRAAPAVRQGLLPAPDRRGRRPQGGRRRPRHRARRAAAHQPLLPGAVGDDPAARRRVRRAPLAARDRSRSSPATRSRSGTSSTPPSGVGIEGLGQVDLERRVHRNQELEGLSRMSFVILQAVMKRLEERRKARLFAEMGSTMKLPRSGRGTAVARGHRAGRPGAPADDPHPRVRRAPRRQAVSVPGLDRGHRTPSTRPRYEAAIPDLAALVVDAVDGGAGVNFLAGRHRPTRPPPGGARRIADVADGTTTAFVARDRTAGSSAPRSSIRSTQRRTRRTAPRSARSSSIGRPATRHRRGP